MIRPIRTSDAAVAWRIFVTSLGYSETSVEVVRRRIAELADSPACISLVWEDEQGQTLGLIHALRYDTLHNGGGWDVITLGVVPEAQGKGIGGKLLAAFEQEARRRGGNFVRLNSSTPRTDAHRFYQQRGYTHDKTQKHFVKQLA